MAAPAAPCPLLLDGGFATQCEAEGADLSSALWSAELLVSRPDLVRAVHGAYAVAGAAVCTTATYQASVEGLATLGCDAAAAASTMAASVTLAREGAREAGVEVLVAGSVGPYGAALADGSEYTAAYMGDGSAPTGRGEEVALPRTVTAAQLAEWHRPRIRALLAGGADLLAAETLPCCAEVTAIAAALDAEAGARVGVWVSASLRADGRLPSGESLGELAATALSALGPRLLAVGVNCVKPAAVLGALKELAAAVPHVAPACGPAGLRAALAALAAGEREDEAPVALLAYPNAGEDWDAGAAAWVPCATSGAPDEAAFAVAAGEWVAAGAGMVGGCCRTTPATIAALHSALLS